MNDLKMSKVKLLHSGWLTKYSRVKHEQRKRFVVVFANDGHGGYDEKIICTFKDEFAVGAPFSEDMLRNIHQATEVIKLTNSNIYCSVMEYFGSLNTNVDNLHFIVDEKFIFKCNTSDERDEWIAKIIKTNNYSYCKNRSH